MMAAPGDTVIDIGTLSEPEEQDENSTARKSPEEKNSFGAAVRLKVLCARVNRY